MRAEFHRQAAGFALVARGTGRLSGLRWCVRGASLLPPPPPPLLLLLSARARGSTECGGGETRKEGW